MRIQFQFSTLVLLMFLFSTIGYSATLGELETKLKQTPNNIPLREKIAASYFKQKKYDKVVQLYAPYSNEISEPALIQLADSYQFLNDPLNEIRILQTYTEKFPNRFRPHFLIGTAYKRARKFDDAAVHLRKSIEYAPKHRPSYDNLLEVFIENKQNYESRILIQDMMRVFGPKKEFQNQLCKLFASDNFLNEAMTSCKSAVSGDPKHPDNHIFLAQTYYNLGNKTAAEKIFHTAARQFSKSEFVQYAAGEYYLNDKQYSIAVRYLEQAAKINPQSQRAQITLALALFETKDYTRALQNFILSCQLDKSSETQTLLKNSAAKLRLSNQNSVAAEYDKRAELCQPSRKK